MKIKDFAQIINGATPSTKNKKYFCGNIVWVTPKDLSINKSKYIRDSEKRITEDAYNSCSTEMIPCDSILLSSRAPIGLLAINKVKCCTNQGFKSLILDKTKANVEYIYYYLKCNIKKIELLGGGTTFKEISKTILENLEIDLPNYKLQYKIAKILSSIDNKIGINNKINDELEAMAKTIYDYWFLQFEFPNEEGKPYKSSGGKMVWNEVLKREIPEGWEIKRLSDIEPNIITGKTPSTKNENYYNGNIPFITISDVRKNMFIVNTEQTLSEEGAKTQEKKYIPEDALCVTCIASPGLVAFSTKLSQTNQQINSIIFEKNYNKLYLYYYLKNYFKYTTGAKTGNTFANMNKEDFSRILVLYPKTKLLTLFQDKTLSLIKLIKKNTIENQELTALRDFLLPVLMNGQVGFKGDKAEG